MLASRLHSLDLLFIKRTGMPRSSYLNADIHSFVEIQLFAQRYNKYALKYTSSLWDTYK